MSLDRAVAHLRQYGLHERVTLFDASSATVELAAQTVGCEPARIAKTLSFRLPDGPVLIVAAGDARIDNAKYKARFHTKATMLPPDQVEVLVGHTVGGVCPFGVNQGVSVFLDESLRRFQTVYPAAGAPNSALELSLPELELASQSQGWVDVCKDWS